ncbi:MAG: M3 family metallopeptidase [Pseudomonadota bacterium]|nr:M3 family metallopeptidase [Pseudomonadota bacterium]
MSEPSKYQATLPDFTNLSAKNTQSDVSSLLKNQRQKIKSLIRDNTKPSFSMVSEIEDMHHKLSKVFSPISHLQNVMDDPDWREAYNSCIPLLTEYGTELSQDPDLEKAYSYVMENLKDKNSAEFALLEKELRSFNLNGVNLSKNKKLKFKKLKKRLSIVEATFGQNVQDSTDSWSYLTDKEPEISGVTNEILMQAKIRAEEKNEKGWKFTLDYPTYHAVMTHGDSRKLRERFYKAWSTRASDQAENKKWDNSKNLIEILTLRKQLSELVGFKNYAEYSLATKMADTTSEVFDFLNDLAEKTKPTALNELKQIESFAGHKLKAWDSAYYLEKLKQKKFAVSDDELKQYFQKSTVQNGMFNVANSLYGITLDINPDIPVWHDSVEFVEVKNSKKEIIGGFYIDLFARNGKRSGAWMDECVIRKKINGKKMLPIGYLVCNFTQPNDKGISLLTHNDVITWFHEFGHMLHHLLTKVDLPSISGINGVPWDAVELPSQFMENFAWNYEILQNCSKHHKTGESLPKDIFLKLQKGRNLGAGLAMLRQLEFALYDISIHTNYEKDRDGNTLDILASVKSRVSLIESPAYNRFPMSFSHVFSGGYAAGYYSYKWAEVLAADAFSAFKESNIFDQKLASRFKEEILEIGGSKNFMQGFKNFRGRDPSLEPLLKQSGIT